MSKLSLLLAAATMAWALSVAPPAAACLLVTNPSSATGGPTFEGLRGIATEVDGERVVAFEVAVRAAALGDFDVMNPALGWLIPLPAGWGPGPLSRARQLQQTLGQLEALTRPVVLRTRSTGCGSSGFGGSGFIDEPLRPDEFGPFSPIGAGWVGEGEILDSLSAVEAWVSARGLELGARGAEQVEAQLLAGARIWALEVDGVRNAFGGLPTVLLVGPEGDQSTFPFDGMAGCWAASPSMALFEVNDAAAKIEGVEVVPVDGEEIVELLEESGIDEAERRIDQSREGLVAFVEYSDAPDERFGGVFLGNAAAPVWLSALRLFPIASELSGALRLVPDPEAAPFNGLLDFRIDPYGHGAALGATPLQLLAGLALFGLWWRRRL